MFNGTGIGFLFFTTAAKHRPYHLGPFPLESLPRDDRVLRQEAARQPLSPAPPSPVADAALARAARKYRDLFSEFIAGDKARRPAPIPEDPHLRMIDAKGYAYFMNAAHVGICQIPDAAWHGGHRRVAHPYALVLLVEHGRLPETGTLAHSWIAPAVGETGDMRAAEIAICLARLIRVYGYAAQAHVAGATSVDMARLAVMAGIAVRDPQDQVVSPYLDDRFSLSVITTDYEMAVDRPLSKAAINGKNLRYWWGLNGAESGRERDRRRARPSHASKYPMERVTQVARPTTLILDDEVPRVPARAAFFERAVKGDLGEKTRKERTRFSLKHPTSNALADPIGRMVPAQDGPVNAGADRSACADPAANSQALKSLSYFLGADLTGICEIPDYAWYSHGKDGKPITPYHKYAVVMLIDQEFETMEGASGDDWISGAQSMRAYMRGGELAGVMAEMMRDLGFSSRTHTVVDSDVLQIPLVLWAGLGELSRIGELVLNPFVGPRFKAVVLTTDMPLVTDKPIDFGLQYFCQSCRKCARECPCDAIPFGDKIMFNGYETWKPDVERCTRYRLTNARGSACGRCMKTCPLNKVVTADGPLAQRIASWLGINAMWLKPLLVPVAVRLDDLLGHGKRNLMKKWWFDVEVVDGVGVTPKGANTRDIDPARQVSPEQIKIAVYHANRMPPPNASQPVPVNRKDAIAAMALVETPDAARLRKARGGEKPDHYNPTPALPEEAP